MYCKHCGNEIDNDVIICTKCGKQVQDLKVTKPTSSTGINSSEWYTDKSAWYFETWFIILMFLFVFPVGIFLLVFKYK